MSLPGGEGWIEFLLALHPAIPDARESKPQNKEENMFNESILQERSPALEIPDMPAAPNPGRSGRLTAGAATVYIALLALTAIGPVRAQNVDFTFTNAVDTTQKFSSFGSMPAINNAGAIAFVSVGSGFESGAV